MTQRASDGIGRRIQRYRRLAGLSARQLSELLGGDLSRGVIANLESGRKTDITVDQLFSLAIALNVPPVALALPIEEPNRMVRLLNADASKQDMRAAYAMEWFLGRTSAEEREGNAAATISRTIIRLLPEFIREAENARRYYLNRKNADAGSADYDKWQALFRESKDRLDELSTHLRDLGVNTDYFEIDE